MSLEIPERYYPDVYKVFPMMEHVSPLSRELLTHIHCHDGEVTIDTLVECTERPEELINESITEKLSGDYVHIAEDNTLTLTPDGEEQAINSSYFEALA